MMMSDDYLKADGFDDAVIGTACVWRDQTREDVLVYSVEKMIVILEAGGMTEEEAIEYISFNVEGAYVGPKTPVFMWDALVGEIND
jgi:hypothetical protein